MNSKNKPAKLKINCQPKFIHRNITAAFDKNIAKGGVRMIKGINRQVVEVNDTGSDYFEKIMFFVKPEYAGISEGKIRERAGLIASKTTAAPPIKIKRSRFADISKYAVAFTVGVICAIAVMYFLKV